MEVLNGLKAPWVYTCFILGVFGNTQIITIFHRNPERKTKTGFFLYLNGWFQLIYLISVLDYFTPIFQMEYPIATCAVFSTMGNAAFMLQAVTTLIMAIDILLNIVLPLRYRLVETSNFIRVVLWIQLLPVLCIAGLCLVGPTITKEKITNCAGVLNLSPVFNRFYNYMSNFILLSTFAVYLVVVYLLKKRVLNKMQRHITRCTIIIVSIWVVNCMLAFSAQTIVDYSPLSDTAKATIDGFLNLHGPLGLIQNFYVYIWQSKQYRAAFKANMGFLTRIRGPKSSTKVSMVSIVSVEVERTRSTVHVI